MPEQTPPRITDPSPPQVQADLERLRTPLDEAILPKIMAFLARCSATLNSPI